MKRIIANPGDTDTNTSINISGHNPFNVNLYRIQVLNNQKTLIWKNNQFLGDSNEYLVSKLDNSVFHLTFRNIQSKDFNYLYCCSDETRDNQCFELLYLSTSGIKFYSLRIFFSKHLNW